MGVGAVLEPLVVVTLLFGGAWVNRARRSTTSSSNFQWTEATNPFRDETHDGGTIKPLSVRGRSMSPSLLPDQEGSWRSRQLHLFGWRRSVETPNTAVFKNRLLSRILRKFPFLVEAWYWALIYWVYQLGRAFTALTIAEGTVDVARKHALQVIKLEEQLHIFWEVPIQQFFMGYPTVMRYINWLYSFIHIPGTIAFLVWLYYYTITTNQTGQHPSSSPTRENGWTANAKMYQARRRTMATCNLMAFIVFTLWPCMPPRLLSDTEVIGEIGDFARSFGFVDTVHGKEGAVSVWTANKFCNQWAAMPSLHFGYSLLVGVTIMTIPLAPQNRRSRSVQLPFFNQSHPSLAPQLRLPSPRRLACLILGFMYPFSILIAIVATANHFILDAVAGAAICALGWQANRVLLNLMPLEDWFLWCVRIHKPAVERPRGGSVEWMDEKTGTEA